MYKIVIFKWCKIYFNRHKNCDIKIFFYFLNIEFICHFILLDIFLLLRFTWNTTTFWMQHANELPRSAESLLIEVIISAVLIKYFLHAWCIIVMNKGVLSEYLSLVNGTQQFSYSNDRKSTPMITKTVVSRPFLLF